MMSSTNTEEYRLFLASKIEDQLERYVLVTNKYQEKGYLRGVDTIEVNISVDSLLTSKGANELEQIGINHNISQLLDEGAILSFGNSHNIYFDKYHWNSIPLIAKSGEFTRGSARLILKDPTGLPTLNDSRITIEEESSWVFDKVSVEFSQFAVQNEPFSCASVGLLKLAYLYSIEVLHINSWIAMIDNSVLRLLNSRLFNFNLPPIGPSIEYLGSLCTPVYIDLEVTLLNSESRPSSKPVADFIRGKDNSGYENIVVTI